MDQVRRDFGDVEIRDPEGQPHRLSDLWSRKPCVLVFVRQFGCILCRQDMAAWKRALPRLREAGAELAVIGTGDPASAKAFHGDLELGGIRVFSDERRRSYELAGFHRGMGTLLSPRAIGNYIRAFFSGYRGSAKQGDAAQQGGVLVIRPDGALLFRHRSRRSGDHADPEQVLAALRAPPDAQSKSSSP